jgi:hypothetical protein
MDARTTACPPTDAAVELLILWTDGWVGRGGLDGFVVVMPRPDAGDGGPTDAPAPPDARSPF